MKLSSKTDRRLILFCLFLLVIQGGWLWTRFINPQAQFKITSLFESKTIGGQNNQALAESIVAGRLYIVTGNVKYKRRGDLFWQNAENGQVIYYFDSLLSGGQSRSNLLLNNKKNIDINENMLITIEPEKISFLQEHIHLKLDRFNPNDPSSVALNVNFRNEITPTTAGDLQNNIDLNKVYFNYGSEKITSTEKTIIEETPAMKLLSPFDRDRIAVGEKISLTWSYIPDTDKYLLKIRNIKTGATLKKITIENSFETYFKNPQEIEWSVIALNKKNKPISTIGTSTFFVSDDLLSPPKLNLVEITGVTKKNKRSSGHNICVLSWQALPHAQYYNIEIARSSDFKNPLLSKQVHENYFHWSINEAGVYYWRVSAGSDKKMGQFSAADKIKIDLNLLSNKKLVGKKIDPDAEREQIETDTDKLLADKPKLILDEKILEKTSGERPKTRKPASR